MVLSDEDDDDSDDTSDSEVFIIDGAAAGESASVAGPGSQARRGNRSSSNVINIDDDDDEGEKDGTGGGKAGPSMSRASGSPAAMTPGRRSPGSRYGLDSMSDSSESDLTEGLDSDTDDGSSDCEILDDTGTAREMWETAASRKKPPHGKDYMSWFCHNASKYYSQYSSGGTKEGPGCAQSSAGNAKVVNGPSVPNAEDVQNNTGRSKEDHHQSSVPNVKECSGSENASEGIQSPRRDENSAYNFASANRVFSGISSTDRKNGSPPISVSTPDKVDDKIPEDAYAQKDQSPPEASYNANIYSAQDNCPVEGKDLLQDPEDLGQFASLIGEREKLKESAEYKRAAEEEWASRHRQLQIQVRYFATFN